MQGGPKKFFHKVLV